jgi:hypothetical protein
MADAWIEVEKELPPLGKKVWVFYGDDERDVEEETFSRWTFENKEALFREHLRLSGVTHWMKREKPAPPQKEGERK